MRDLATAIGLILAIEGLSFAAFPAATRRALEVWPVLDRARVCMVSMQGGVI